MELTINQGRYEVTRRKELEVHWMHVRGTQFAEIWMRHATDWPAICALVNGDAAWLMYLRHEGDAGLSTRNPKYSGRPKKVIESYLSNGQRDEYPASWNVTTKQALRALEYFFWKQAMAPWLEWQEERPSVR